MCIGIAPETTATRIYVNAFLGGELQIDPKNSNFDIFESAPILNQGVCPFQSSCYILLEYTMFIAEQYFVQCTFHMYGMVLKKYHAL